MSQQVMRITGELQIDAIGGYRELKGEVSFLGPNSYKYGRIRVYGSSGFYSFINDVTGCSQGFNVRTLSNQGDSQVGGTNNQFPFSVVNQEIRGMFINIDQKLQGQNVLFNGLPNLQINRNSTADTTSLTNSIGTFTQTQWKANENNQILVGFSPFFGYSTFGYYSPSATGTNITTNEGYVGIWNNGNMIKTIKWRPDGTVEIPLQLNVDTINATNYLNLPPTDLTPIHLDKTNGRVGIGTSTPDEKLQVAGDMHVDNQIRSAQCLIGDGTFTSMGVGTAGINTLVVTDNSRFIGDVTAESNLYVGTSQIHLDGVNGLIDLKNATINSGASSPEGSVIAAPGSVFMQTTGKLWVKKTGVGNTGWGEITNTATTPTVLEASAVDMRIEDLWAYYCRIYVSPGVYTATLQITTPPHTSTEKRGADYYFGLLCESSQISVAYRYITSGSTQTVAGGVVKHQVIDTLTSTFEVTTNDSILAKVRRYPSTAGSTEWHTVTLHLTVTKHT